MSKLQKWIDIDRVEALNELIADPTYAGFILDDSAALNWSDQDIQKACDWLLSRYQETNNAAGFFIVPENTLAAVEKQKAPNIMAALRASVAGLASAQKYLFDGINVFFKAYSLSQYEKAMKLYLRVIEDRDIHFRPLRQVRSFISFDVAAIESEIEKQLQQKHIDYAQFQHKTTIALVKLAKQKYNRYFSGDSWTWLANHDAQPQTILVNLNGVANPQFYVDELAACTTHFAFSQNQLELEIHLNNENDHASIEDAPLVLRDLGELGIHLDELGEFLVGGQDP